MRITAARRMDEDPLLEAGGCRGTAHPTPSTIILVAPA
jgi:hypothetical protein